MYQKLLEIIFNSRIYQVMLRDYRVFKELK